MACMEFLNVLYKVNGIFVILLDDNVGKQLSA